MTYVVGDIPFEGQTYTAKKALVDILNAIAAGGVAGITAVAAEINVLTGVTPGTVLANHGVVTGANKHIDTIAISDGGLKLGTGAGTAVTATAAELNLMDDQPASATLTPAAGASNISAVTIQAKDAAGVNMARAVWMLVWLSDAATGIGLTAHASVTVAAGAKGADMGILTANKCLLVQTDAAGAYILTITDANKTGFYVAAKFLNGSAPSISAQLVAGDYGA